MPTTFRAPSNSLTLDAPLALLTGRVRDQWHTMTRTGPVARLMAHTPEPLLLIHPDDADDMPDCGLARVISAWGHAVLRLRHDATMMRGTVFAPMHWTSALAPAARVNTSVNPATDPISGQQELKHTPVRVEAFQAAWHGFVLTRRSVDLAAMAWSASIPCEGDIQRFELAGQEPPADAFGQLRNIVTESAAYWVTLEDASLGLYRAALLKDRRLLAVVMLGRDEKLPPREWLLGLMAAQQITLSERRALLSGQPANGLSPSPTLCVCHSVRASGIAAAISAGCSSLTAIGEATKAGTGCGSCRPEIALLLSRTLEPA